MPGDRKELVLRLRRAIMVLLRRACAFFFLSIVRKIVQFSLYACFLVERGERLRPVFDAGELDTC